MTDDQIVAMIEATARKTIEECVPRVIKDTMTTMGVDVHSPLTMQQDFAFLRGLRNSVGAAIAAAVAGVGGGIVSMWDLVTHFDKH